MEGRMKLQNSDCTILVQSSNVDLGSALPEYARASILRVANKYFGTLNVAAAHFSREGGAYRCTVNIQMGTLRMMSGEAENKNAYAAFRSALEKVAKQLRRAKRELREDKAYRIDKGTFVLQPKTARRQAGRASSAGAVEFWHLVDAGDDQMPPKLDGESVYRIAAE
jgi:ribosomal subunit interface protein